MASKSKQVLQKSLITRKEFNYSQNNITLNFTLRVDNSSELRPFLNLLKEATSDIEEVLKGMMN